MEGVVGGCGELTFTIFSKISCSTMYRWSRGIGARHMGQRGGAPSPPPRSDCASSSACIARILTMQAVQYSCPQGRRCGAWKRVSRHIGQSSRKSCAPMAAVAAVEGMVPPPPVLSSMEV